MCAREVQREMTASLLVLDAMGVIYEVKDDVADLLVPYIRINGGASSEVVEECYREASLGNITEDDFWTRVGMSPDCEDDYLATFTLSSGLGELLETAHGVGLSIAALTNDVPRWSRKLRARFGLTNHITTWVVSGEERCRKPDPRIYESLIGKCQVKDQGRVLFVDDRLKNIDTAASFGWRTALFKPEEAFSSSVHSSIQDFSELREMISRQYCL